MIFTLYSLLTTSMLFLMFIFIVSEAQPTRPPILRTMTFNTWLAGRKVENGLTKIVKQIKGLHADIVFLQEMDAKAFDDLLLKLGHQWTGLIHNEHRESKPAILTKHKIIAGTKWHTDWTFGLTIFHDKGIPINVVNAHLNYRGYGPYIVAKSKKNNDIDSDRILAADFEPEGESDIGRLRNIIQMKDHSGFQKFLIESSKETPLILAGDFNEPSHLDWTEKTKDLHKDYVVEWPVTKFLSEKLGMIDSFRQLHGSILNKPGSTWSSVWDDPEPQDRIDFVFYKSTDMLKPVRSFTFSGSDPLRKLPEPEHWVEDGELADGRDWPSDHLALVTDFELRIGSKE